MKESATDPHALRVTSEEDMLKKLRHSEVCKIKFFPATLRLIVCLNHELLAKLSFYAIPFHAGTS